MHNAGARLCGLALLSGSAGCSLLHREIFRQATAGPPHVLEFGLALISFVLASAGIALVIYGGRLFDHEADLAGRVDHSPRDPAPGEGLLDPDALNTRNGVALVVARRAINAAAIRRPAPSALRSAAMPHCPE